MNRRMTAVLATVVTAGALAIPAQAALAAPHGHGHGGPGSAGHVAATTGATAGSVASSEKHPAKHVHHKVVRFTAVGVVTAVDGAAGTLTVHVVAAHKGQRGADITVSVVEATKIVRGRAHATLAKIEVGDRVTVVGFRSDKGCVASHITAVPRRATSPSPAPSSSDSPAPSSSGSPQPAPTDSTPAPVTSPTDATPSATPSA